MPEHSNHVQGLHSSSQDLQLVNLFLVPQSRKFGAKR